MGRGDKVVVLSEGLINAFAPKQLFDYLRQLNADGYEIRGFEIGT